MTQKLIRSRGWCFTINNDTYDDMDAILDLNCDFLCFGFEEGDEEHTPHIQGYAYFSNARTFKSIKKSLKRAHLEPALGSAVQNRKYCSKEGDYYEFGKIPHQGQRNDLEELKKKIDEGLTYQEIIDQFPSQYIRYHSGIEKMMAHRRNSWSEDNIKETIKVSYVKENDLTINDEAFVACCEKDLIAYNHEKELIIFNSKKFDTYKLQLLTKYGRPYLVNNGYIMHKIRPFNLIIVTN